MSAPREVSFAGCKNRAEVLARLTAFLERYCDDVARETAAAMLEWRDLDEIPYAIVEQRDLLARQRDECVARCVEIFDRELGPKWGTR